MKFSAYIVAVGSGQSGLGLQEGSLNSSRIAWGLAVQETWVLSGFLASVLYSWPQLLYLEFSATLVNLKFLKVRILHCFLLPPFSFNQCPLGGFRVEVWNCKGLNQFLTSLLIPGCNPGKEIKLFNDKIWWFLKDDRKVIPVLNQQSMVGLEISELMISLFQCYHSL